MFKIYYQPPFFLNYAIRCRHDHLHMRLYEQCEKIELIYMEGGAHQSKIVVSFYHLQVHLM